MILIPLDSREDLFSIVSSGDEGVEVVPLLWKRTVLDMFTTMQFEVADRVRLNVEKSLS